MPQELPQEITSEPSSSKRSSSFKVAVVIVILVSIWIMSGIFADRQEKLSGANIRTSYELPKVTVVTMVSRVRDETVTVYGATEPSRSVDLSAEVEGKVVEIIAQEGSTLKAGAPILKIDSQDRAEKLSEARARVKQRDMEFKAAKALASRGFQAETSTAAAKADLEEAKAELAKAKINMDRTTVKAPFDGVFETLDVEVGELIGSSGNSNNKIGRFVSNNPLTVVGKVSEREVADIWKGSKAKVRLITGDDLEATVSYVSSVADSFTHTFRVELKLENPDYAIPAGVTAEMIISTGEEDAHLIPSSVLTLNGGGILGVKIFLRNVSGLKTVDKSRGKGLVSFFPVQISEDTGKGIWVYGLPDVIDLIVLGQAFVEAGDIVIAVDKKGNPIGGSNELNN